ncbi:hypothetical protein BH11MYX1_BH11MYX1_40150 [soil metagenome]
MRFCPWYPLSEAATRVPAGESVLQLRVAEGLIDYPRGKSAMVHYAHTLDAVTVAVALAWTYRDLDLWCRHLELEGDRDVDLSAFHGKLLHESVRRFGRAPSP